MRQSAAKIRIEFIMERNNVTKEENKKIKEEELVKLSKLHSDLLNHFTEEFRFITINKKKSRYICSNFGNVYNTHKSKDIQKWTKMTPIRMYNGYYVLSLRHEGKYFRDYIHRLVAKEFIEIPEKYNDISIDKLEVNHKKGYEKWNNTIFNLEWTTSSDNKLHAYKTNLNKKGEENHFAFHNNETVEYICQLIESNQYSVSDIAKLTGTKKGFVYDILYKGSWTHISDKYDFSHYKPKQKKYTDEQISYMQKLLSDSSLSFKEISKLTGIKIKTIYYYNSKLK